MSPERLALQILCLNDFEAAARARLPRPIFGYVQGAVEDNLSFRMNADAFRQYAFITRTLTDVSGRDTRRHLLGKTYASPFGICPMGLLGLSCFEGDLNMVGAARDADVPCIISGASMIPMEEIARHAPHTWFQAYVKGNPESYRPMLARIDAAGFRTLVEQRAHRLYDAAATRAAAVHGCCHAPEVAVRHAAADACQARHAVFRELVRAAGGADFFPHGQS
ncbi:MAG: hypothetical protein ABT05_08230 [Lautropia sp. SCN 66-9]|nr:MAG: hypothetical protein ABT05_08230 [Lautropia sp. SCN 66-9]